MPVNEPGPRETASNDRSERLKPWSSRSAATLRDTISEDGRAVRPCLSSISLPSSARSRFKKSMEFSMARRSSEDAKEFSWPPLPGDIVIEGESHNHNKDNHANLLSD